MPVSSLHCSPTPETEEKVSRIEYKGVGFGIGKTNSKPGFFTLSQMSLVKLHRLSEPKSLLSTMILICVELCFGGNEMSLCMYNT